MSRFGATVCRLLDPERSPLPLIPWVARLIFQTAPAEAYLNAAAVLLIALGPPLSILLTRRLVDSVSGAGAPGEVWQDLAALAAALVLSDLAGTLFPVTNSRIFTKLPGALKELLLRKAAGLSLIQFDDPALHDLIERAGGEEHGRRAATVWNRLLWVLAQGVRAISAAAILGAISPTLAAGTCLVALPLAWAGSRQGRRLFRLSREQTQERRLADYLSRLLSDRLAAVELRAYQLSDFFLGRWRAILDRHREREVSQFWQGAREGSLADLGALVMLAGALGLLVRLAGGGQVSPGEVVATASAVLLLRTSVAQLGTDAGTIWEHGLPLLDLHRLLQLRAEPVLRTGGREVLQALAEPIRLEGVSFRYPGLDRPVLANLTLEIRPGERLALVGLNGAGKSTLVKLLLGLYTPTSGRILIGGTDIREFDPGWLHRHVSSIFQDFSRYELTLAENIAVGRPGASRDEVESAAEAAGLKAVAEGLPQGYDTLLGRSFAGGVELSGGQWQRVALARAYIRDAGLLVLDEPTAALDARAELELFGKFVELVRGRTAILISHRLGVARLADRIVVLAEGHVAECGSHDQLMRLGGLYARLFQTQAQWYEEKAVV